MLSELRKGAAGFLFKLLLGFLALSFAVWGIADVIRQPGAQIIATVGGEDITLTEFDKQISILRRTFGEKIPHSGLNQLILQRKVLNEMIAVKLLGLEAERLGLRISDEALAQEISRNEDFRNSSGVFDKTLFQQSLRQINLNESQYLRQLQDELKQSLLANIMDGESALPKGYAKHIYYLYGEQRTVDLLTILSPGKNYNLPSPSDAEITAYYDEHKNQFMAPEYRTVAFIQLTPEDIAKRVQVKRQEVFELYNERSESLMIPEKRDITQMLFNTKAEAENMYSILRSGTTLKEAMKLVKPSNQDSIELGMVTKEQLPNEAAKVFSLDTGEFTEPTESRFGWHIYVVRKIQEAKVTPFNDVQKSLEEEVRQQKMEIELNETIEQLEDALAGTDNLVEAAKESERTLTVTEPVDASGYGVDRQLLLPQSQYGEILQTAFSLPAGDRSELMRQANGGYYVVRVNAVTAPRQRTLDEVRGQVTDAWKSEHLHEAKHQYAQSLAKELAATKTAAEAEAVIKRHSLKRTTQVTLRRNGIITGLENTVLPPSLIQEIFEIKNVGKATSAQLMDDHYTIALLRSVKAAADPKTNLQTNQQLQALRRKLRSDYRKEILEQYISHLRTRYPVQINEAVLARLAETNK